MGLCSLRSYGLEAGSLLAFIAICWLGNVTGVSDLALTAMVAIVAAPYLWIGSLQRLAWLLGALLPVYTLTGTPDLMWDGLRICIIAALLLRAGLSQEAFNAPVVAIASAGLGFIFISASTADLETARYGASLLLGVATAACVGPRLRRSCLTGFAAGAVASSGAVLLEVGTGISIGSGYQGVTGFIGLGSVSTNTGPQLALAVAVILLGYTGFNPASAVLMATVVSIGVLMTGSRAGLMTLVLFGCAMLASNRLRVIWRVVLVSSLATLVAVGAALSWAAVDRLLDIGALSVERQSGVDAGIRFFFASPLLGVHGPIPGVTDLTAQTYIYTTYLNWPAYFGLFGVLAVICVFTTLAFGGLPWQVTLMVLFMACLEFDGLLAGGSILPVILLLSMRDPTSSPRELASMRASRFRSGIYRGNPTPSLTRTKLPSRSSQTKVDMQPVWSKC